MHWGLQSKKKVYVCVNISIINQRQKFAATSNSKFSLGEKKGCHSKVCIKIWLPIVPIEF